MDRSRKLVEPDPLLATLLNVPDDDEPTTVADLTAIVRGREAYRRGETIRDDDVACELKP